MILLVGRLVGLWVAILWAVDGLFERNGSEGWHSPAEVDAAVQYCGLSLVLGRWRIFGVSFLNGIWEAGIGLVVLYSMGRFRYGSHRDSRFLR